MHDDQQTTVGRTTSSEFNRILPLVLTLLLWGLCRQLGSGVIPAYARGFFDGAFTLFVAISVARLARSYRDEGGERLLDARKGVMLGIVLALGTLLLITLGLSLR